MLVISSDGREGSATIHQEADIYRVRLPKGQSMTHEVQSGRGVWFQLIQGSVNAHDSALQAGDAFSTEDVGTLTLRASDDVEGLLFDLA